MCCPCSKALPTSGCRAPPHRSPRSAGSACAWHPHSRGSEKTPAMPLRPARVAILLAQFCRLIIPLLRYPTSLHRLVLIATVALRRNRHNRGINHLPTTRYVAFGSEVLVEAVE